MSTKPTIAFFGATGGTVVTTLADAVRGKHTCRALVRSRAKLEGLLTDRGASDKEVSAQLTIIEGDVKDAAAVIETLQIDKSDVVNIIISGIGSYPTLQLSLLKPVSLRDPTLCQDATKNILSALRTISAPNKPLYITMGTTGVSDTCREVPIIFAPLYHWLLAIPHEDKKEVESLLVADVKRPDTERVIHGFIAIRASLLTDGKRLGIDQVRVGTEQPRLRDEDEVAPANPAIGYTISREDVGGWIYEKIVQGGSDVDQEFLNKYVTITY